MSEDLWFGCCPRESHDELLAAIRALEPNATLVTYSDAAALRRAFTEGEPGLAAAAVGLCAEGVSDVNLAAAIAADGRARKVVLFERGASGSERSRARRAGITQVVDLDEQAVRAGAGDLGSPKAFARGEGARIPARAERGGGTMMGEGLAPTIVFSSGRGGVGKTTLAALAASTAAGWGMRVAVVDLDLACGNLYTCFGLAHGVGLDKLAGKEAPSEDELLAAGAQVAKGVRLWGPCTRPEMAERASSLVPQLLGAVAHAADLVIVDTSATATDASAQAFQHCDRLALVHDERLGGIGSLARTSALAVRLGVARTRIIRIANHGDRHSRFDLTAGRAEVGLETARAYRVLEGGAEVGDLLAEGRAVDLAGLDSDVSTSMAQALAQVLEELGRLPAGEGPKRALAQAQGKRRRLVAKRRAS